MRLGKPVKMNKDDCGYFHPRSKTWRYIPNHYTNHKFIFSPAYLTGCFTVLHRDLNRHIVNPRTRVSIEQ